MDKTNYRYRLLARITLETTTPLAVGSGEKGIISDSLVATDVNGLPYIPATSIAGVLRHAIGEEKAKSFFGNPDKGNTGSEIIFTEAKLLNKDGKPIDGLVTIDKNDGFLRHYFNLPIRQHASLNDKGCVNDKGKFDEQIVYKGSRFCFEIEMLSTTLDNDNFKNVPDVICSSEFKVGSGTTCGFGSLQVKWCKTRCLDMTNSDDMKFYADKSSDLSKDWDGKDYPHEGVGEYPHEGVGEYPHEGIDKDPHEGADGQQKYTIYELSLIPDDFFLFGSGFGDDDADITPVKESVVTWNNGEADFSSQQVLIPATSVKGAIAHRTAYHYNKLCEYFVNDEMAKAGNENTAVQELFGYADDKGKSQKGNVAVSDVFIPEGTKDKVEPHVAIDRFTGGTIDGALFSEKVTYGNHQSITLKVSVRGNDYSKNVVEALEQSFIDICKGLLPLGGGVNRGNGAFTGKLIKNGEIIYG